MHIPHLCCLKVRTCMSTGAMVAPWYWVWRNRLRMDDGGPFYNWFKDVFIPQLGPNPSKIPYLLIFDGHESHISYNLLRTAIDNNIHNLCLPAHCSHLLQPLDVSVFRAAKVAWKKILKDHYRQTRLKKASVRKEVLPSLIAKLYDSAFKQELF